MAALIGFVLGEFEFEFFVLGLICALVAIAPGRRQAGERLLAYYVLFSVGCLHLVNFVFHVFFGAMSARVIGWADSPFQTELGFASLGFALVGFLAWRGSYPMRVAAVVGPTPFLLGGRRRPHLPDRDRRKPRRRKLGSSAMDGCRHPPRRTAFPGDRACGAD